MDDRCPECGGDGYGGCGALWHDLHGDRSGTAVADWAETDRFCWCNRSLDADGETCRAHGRQPRIWVQFDRVPSNEAIR